jgi:endo-1,4-beta-xylanase
VHPTSSQVSTLVIGLVALACAGGDDAPGARGSGGGPAGTGGASGGSTTGGAAGKGTGGAAGSGDLTTAGSAGTQLAGSGGNSGSGGTGSGGTPAGGGSGGTPCTNVRPTGTQWDEATCEQWATETSECGNPWMVNGNYCNESCGRCSSSSAGGSAGTGGGANGGSGGVPPSGCTEAQGTVCNNQTGRHCGYTYEYWKDQGSGCLTNKADGFSVEWNNINNLLGRKGLRPGSRNQIVDYDANYQPNGNSYLCVYGWTQSPLVEYYIVDSWGSFRPPGGQSVATVTSDGGTYEIYRTQRVNQPSIEGKRTFYQYWSVRTEKRTRGTITVANHFNAWQNSGFSVGSLYEVSMTVEGYQSSGSADVTMSMR